MSAPEQSNRHRSASSSSARGSLAWLAVFQPKGTAATLARASAALALQDRFLAILNAAGAYAMPRLSRRVIALQGVNEATRFRLLKFVTGKLALKLLGFVRCIVDYRQLRFQLCVRKCRISHLRSQLRDGGFQFCVARDLRSAEKSAHSLRQVQALICGPGSLVRNFDGSGKSLKVNGHV